MSNYFLRVEAVNLDNSIFDTYQISAIRGGSFILFEAVKALQDDASTCNELVKISEGASTGLYSLPNASSDQTASIIRERVLEVLHKKAPAATFVADYYDFESEDCSSDFARGIKMLIAKNRWAQWRQATVVLPEKATAKKACTLDGLRPGIHDDGEEKVSDATLERMKFGRTLRKDLYKTILKDSKITVQVTKDLEALSNDSQKGNLNGKIAFIYLDGNKFGSIRDEYCRSGAELKRFDDVVQQELRATVLRKILETAREVDNFKTASGEYRIETLLWGGDEIEWVVPAWIGWRVLEIFYSMGLPFNGIDQDLEAKKIPLTHAGGIVFCSHSAPILQIRRIAHDLADKVKETIINIPETHRAGNIVQYLVLESFDMLEGSLESFIDTYYNAADFSDLMIQGEDIPEIKESFKILQSLFPRNKVFEIVAALKVPGQDVDSTNRKVDEITTNVLEKLGDDKERVKQAIEAIIRSNTNRWYCIADLWDFFKEQ